MKILQIFGAVVAVHLLAFIFIFASPGCQSGPRNVPTPDATMPGAADTPSLYNSYTAAYNSNAAPQPVDLGTASSSGASASGQHSPTRPGSPSAVAIAPTRVIDDVSPVTTYTIVKGDSLWSVAKKNHLTVAELAKANKISAGAAVRPGQKLMVPVKAAPATPAAAPKEIAPVAAPAAKSAAVGADGVKHTVQSGESLGVIARKYQVSVGELAAANNITDPSKVRAGQVLVIPGFKAVGPKSNATASSRTLTQPKPATAAPAASTPPAATTTPPPAGNAAPHFEITAPPPGQDLDAGLKEAPTEVPTIRVEESGANK